MWDPKVDYEFVLQAIAYGVGTNSATSGEVFETFEDLLRYSPGDAQASATLTTIDDDLPEGNEALKIELLRNAADGDIVLGGPKLDVDIIDNDAEIKFENTNESFEEPDQPNRIFRAPVQVLLTRADSE